MSIKVVGAVKSVVKRASTPKKVTAGVVLDTCSGGRVDELEHKVSFAIHTFELIESGMSKERMGNGELWKKFVEDKVSVALGELRKK